MRYKCECGARISTLRNLRSSEDNISRIGCMLVIRGDCSCCGKSYAFIPYLIDPKKVKKYSQNWKATMFGRYLEKKLKT